jgi:hypothetical protein
VATVLGNVVNEPDRGGGGLGNRLTVSAEALKMQPNGLPDALLDLLKRLTRCDAPGQVGSVRRKRPVAPSMITA